MKKHIYIFLITFSLSFFALAERMHTITLKGAVKKGNEILTMDKIKKDFSNLTLLKTSLQDEPVQEFEGITLKEFVEKYAEGSITKMRVRATNAYEQILTTKDWIEWGGLLVFLSDKKIIPTKTRGTFRIVYDYKKHKENIVTLETNSIWQVIEIEFIK